MKVELSSSKNISETENLWGKEGRSDFEAIRNRLLEQFAGEGVQQKITRLDCIAKILWQILPPQNGKGFN